MIFDHIKQGLECCLVGECKTCPFYPIPDRRQCRASLYDHAADYFRLLDTIVEQRDALADRVYELEEMIEELEEAET